MYSRILATIGVVAMLVLVLSGCGPTPEPEVVEKIVTKEVEKVITQVVQETVKETVIVAGTPEVVEREVTKVVEVEVTAVPTSAPNILSRPMVVCAASEAVTMDPHANDYGYSRSVQTGPYEALLRWEEQPDGSWAPGPNLAKSWEVSDDGLEYTFYLEEGVAFSDGEPFNAEAVKWNFERLGALGLQPATKVYEAANLVVEAVDDYTVKVTLPQPYAPFIYQMIQNPMFISPAAAVAHQVEGDYGEYGDYAQAWLYEHAVGTGPYLLSEWRHGENASLVKNPAYWRGWEGNHLDSVVTKFVGEGATRKVMLEGGECDLTYELTSTDIPALEENPEVVVWTRPGIDVLTIQIRPRGPFADPRVRQAVALAFDYDAFADNILLGRAVPANGPLIPVEFGWNPDLPGYKQDLEKAKELMAEAGYPGGIEGEQEMWIIPSFMWFLRSEAELLQANLAELGIDVKIVEFGEPAPWLAGVFDPDPEKQPTFFAWNWGGRTGDPDSNLRDMYHGSKVPPDGMNGAFFDNPEVNELLDKGVQEPDPEKRTAIYADIQDMLIEEQPFLWLAYQETYFPHRAELKGYVLPPLQEWYFSSYYDMWLEGEE